MAISEADVVEQVRRGWLRACDVGGALDVQPAIVTCSISAEMGDSNSCVWRHYRSLPVCAFWEKTPLPFGARCSSENVILQRLRVSGLPRFVRLLPWGFDLAEIRVSTRVVYGLTDVLVPRQHGDWLAAMSLVRK